MSDHPELAQPHGHAAVDPYHHGEGGATGKFNTYMYVFYALAVCTALSFVFNTFLGPSNPLLSAALIMVVAVIKAALVIIVFMHMSHDWGKLYGIFVPVAILAVMMVIILSIDTTVAWHILDPVGEDVGAATVHH